LPAALLFESELKRIGTTRMGEETQTASYAKLRELDLAMHEVDLSLEALQTTIRREKDAVSQADAVVASIEETIKALKTKERAVELQLRSIDQDIVKFDAAAKTASSSSVFELTERAMAAKRAEREAAENEGLELLDRLDTMANKLKEAQSATKARQAALIAAEAMWHNEQPVLAAKMLKLVEETNAILRTLPDGFGERYWESIKHPGRPVFARIKDASCSSCGNELPTSVVSSVEHGGAETCGACLRFLLKV